MLIFFAAGQRVYIRNPAHIPTLPESIRFSFITFVINNLSVDKRLQTFVSGYFQSVKL